MTRRKWCGIISPVSEPSKKPSSTKFMEARRRLPDALQGTYAQLVEEYEFRTSVHYGRGYVAYQVLADLVLLGWRPTGEDLLSKQGPPPPKPQLGDV